MSALTSLAATRLQDAKTRDALDDSTLLELAELPAGKLELSRRKELQAREVQPPSSHDDAAVSTTGAKTIFSGTKLANVDVLIREAIESGQNKNETCQAGGWVELGPLGAALRRNKPSWDVRNYGVSKTQGLSGLLQLSQLQKLFEYETEGTFARVRERRPDGGATLAPFPPLPARK
jgi:hypothetical protein